MVKQTKKKIEERVYFDTKYGPLTIHQNGVAVKELTAKPVLDKPHCTHVVEKMRLSLHLERFQGIEPFLEEIKCVINFPEVNSPSSHDAHCQMRVGFTHGAAVVNAEPIFLNLANVTEPVMEVEYFLAEKSVIKLAIPVKLSV